LFQNPVLKAQYVTIPDAHFVTYLQTNFPSCMVGNQMDTTCAAITSATTLNCANDSIADLTGIQYFDNLSVLLCSHNSLTWLPPLPHLLTNLSCDNNLLTSLPPLPNSLITLNCPNNQLVSLPFLPSGFINLDCDYNFLTSLPILPNGIQIIWCTSNNLTSLPSLPNSIVELLCSQNSLTNLPILPTSLQALNCYYNQLTSLPVLPTGLIALLCGNNQITNIPTLPNTLTDFWCPDCLLTNLPTLPTALHSLVCNGNQLTNLPTLPNTLTGLLCNNNIISCFPILPTSLIDTGQVNISMNPFTCLPNYVSGLNFSTLAYPLCITGNLMTNPNNCTGAVGIVGYSFKDTNGDCIYNIGDSTIINVQEKLYDSGNNLLDQTYSAINGIYDFSQPNGTYTVKIDTTGVPYTTQCTYPGLDSVVTLTSVLPLQTDVNFNITCKSGFDVGVQSCVVNGSVFPGQRHSLNFLAGDLSNWYHLHCAAGISGQVVITVTGPVTFNGVTIGALTPTVAGNVFTYTIADFGATNISKSFGLVLTIDSTAQNGNTICINAIVTPAIGDNDTINNNFNYCYQVVNSYDPNYKATYPVNVHTGFTDYFTYTIHFQNTGSAAANNIHLQDTLDANLDLNTFQVINYSHTNNTWLTGNKLSVSFPNINLPDSSSNFAGSQGFIQYRIKPKAGLPAGTLLHNTGYIYFDYNAPIVTNTTVNEFSGTAGVANIQHPASVSIYPNPFTEQTTITFSEEQKNTVVRITDVLGKEMKTVTLSAARNIVIDKGEMSKGIYFVEITDNMKNRINRKIIVE
jgi:uncharacterized repeat protein (TIGR01451 family)